MELTTSKATCTPCPGWDGSGGSETILVGVSALHGDRSGRYRGEAGRREDEPVHADGAGDAEIGERRLPVRVGGPRGGAEEGAAAIGDRRGDCDPCRRRNRVARRVAHLDHRLSTERGADLRVPRRLGRHPQRGGRARGRSGFEAHGAGAGLRTPPPIARRYERRASTPSSRPLPSVVLVRGVTDPAPLSTRQVTVTPDTGLSASSTTTTTSGLAN